MSEIRRRPRGVLPARAEKPAAGSCVVMPPGDTIALTVFGRPAPQGSKTPMGFEANHRTRPWREAIRALCVDKLPPDWEKLDGPLSIEMWFYFDRLKGHRSGDLPCTKSTYDVDKLSRAMNDGLTEGGVIVDDARVVDMYSHKRYCEIGTETRALVIVSPYFSPLP